MAYYGTPLPEDQYDGRDDAPDPCETCGGNFEGVDCASLCDGCEGCAVTGAACHGCTCAPSPPDYGPDEYCYRCRLTLYECKCSGGPTTIAMTELFNID